MLAPMRAVAPTIRDTIAELPYREAGSLSMDPPAPVPWVERAAMLRDVTPEAIDAMLLVLGPASGTRLTFVELRRLGGALDRVPEAPNAVTGRGARWSLFAVGGGQPDLAPLFEQQLTTLVNAVAPWAQGEIMLPNLISTRQGTNPQEMRVIYGSERYDRLAAIKTRYDPRNLFRMNHNITPVTSAN